MRRDFGHEPKVSSLTNLNLQCQRTNPRYFVRHCGAEIGDFYKERIIMPRNVIINPYSPYVTQGMTPNFASNTKQTLLFPLKLFENHRFSDDFWRNRSYLIRLNLLRTRSKILGKFLYFYCSELSDSVMLWQCQLSRLWIVSKFRF